MRVIFVLFFTWVASGCLPTVSSRTVASEDPYKTYSVELSESIGNELAIVFGCSIYANVKKGNTQLAEPIPLYAFDDGRCDFNQHFSSSSWVTSNVLRFAKAGSEPEKEKVIRIINDSGRPIRAMKVQALDLFLIMDVGPGQDVSFNIAHQKSSTWINVWSIDDAGIVSQRQTNFAYADRSQPAEFKIFYEETGIQLSGYLKNSGTAIPAF